MSLQRDGSVAGLVATPASAAFTRAGIPFVWEDTPSKRILLLIKNGQGLDCAVGWYEAPDRRQWAKFTKPIYVDKPMVGIVRSNLEIPNEIKLFDLVLGHKLRLLLKDGFSYGPVLGDALAKLTPDAAISITGTSLPDMVKMIKGNRADIMFVPQEEADYYLGEETGAQDIRIVKFPDIGTGFARHIMCSDKVEDDIIKRLDAAIGSSPLRR